MKIYDDISAETLTHYM